MALRVLTSANKLYRKYAQTRFKAKYEDFLKHRSLDENTSQDFHIGFAPKGNVFLNYLNSIPSPDKEQALKIAQEIGIIKQVESWTL